MLQDVCDTVVWVAVRAHVSEFWVTDLVRLVAMGGGVTLGWPLHM